MRFYTVLASGQQGIQLAHGGAIVDPGLSPEVKVLLLAHILAVTALQPIEHDRGQDS
jgi:hypothetical protein